MIEKGITALANCPYAPELNLIERYIRIHKNIIRQRLRNNRIISKTALIETAEAIIDEDFKIIYDELLEDL